MVLRDHVRNYLRACNLVVRVIIRERLPDIKNYRLFIVKGVTNGEILTIKYDKKCNRFYVFTHGCYNFIIKLFQLTYLSISVCPRLQPILLSILFLFLVCVSIINLKFNISFWRALFSDRSIFSYCWSRLNSICAVYSLYFLILQIHISFLCLQNNLYLLQLLSQVVITLGINILFLVFHTFVTTVQKRFN